MNQIQSLGSRLRNSVTFKVFVILILTLLLLIPKGMITSLIYERENRQNEAVREISQKWSEEQTVVGPVLTLPYHTYIRASDQTLQKVTRYAHFLPDQLRMDGQVEPELRSRSIYEAVVYQTQLQFAGEFPYPDVEELGLEQEDVLWDQAFVSIGIPDMRGIQEQIVIDWNREYKLAFEPSLPTNDVLASGVSVEVPLPQDSLAQERNLPFSFDLSLNGSQGLFFVPLGRITEASLTSPWAHPSFNGAFLPDEHEITDNGFAANWKVLDLNRNFPQQWKGSRQVAESAFGLNLLVPVDRYQKAMRTVKYAVMIIGLTFLTFFFVEVLNNKRIHPIQYLLVGLALVLFYLLVLSFSEHFSFNVAYWFSAAGIIALITLYSLSVLRSKSLSAMLGGVLLVLYGFIFTLTQLHDVALLIGSVGLFIVLALIMYLSRKIDWYSYRLAGGDEPEEVQPVA